MWFSKEHPSADIHSVRPVPVSVVVTIGPMLPNIKHLPPLSFLPTTTAYSARCATGLLHPAASHGVRMVSASASLVVCHHTSQSSAAFPHPHLTPFEAFPCLKAVLRHRSRCRLVVTRQNVTILACSTSRPFSFKQSVVASGRFPPAPTRCSLGLASPSRCSLRVRCPSGQPRGVSALAASPWATPTGVVAP